MNGKLRWLLIVSLSLALVAVIGCSTKKEAPLQPSLEFGLNWDQTKGTLVQKVAEIPSKQSIYAYFNYQKPLEVKDILAKINLPDGSNISGVGVTAKPEDKGILIPLQIDTPGQYTIQIVTGDKKLFEQEVMVK